jgi:hypothetical protein
MPRDPKGSDAGLPGPILNILMDSLQSIINGASEAFKAVALEEHAARSPVPEKNKPRIKAHIRRVNRSARKLRKTLAATSRDISALMNELEGLRVMYIKTKTKTEPALK